MAVKLGEHEVRDVSACDLLFERVPCHASVHAALERTPLVAGLCGRVLQKHGRFPSCFQAGNHSCQPIDTIMLRVLCFGCYTYMGCKGEQRLCDFAMHANSIQLHRFIQWVRVQALAC